MVLFFSGVIFLLGLALLGMGLYVWLRPNAFSDSILDILIACVCHQLRYWFLLALFLFDAVSLLLPIQTFDHYIGLLPYVLASTGITFLVVYSMFLARKSLCLP